MEMMSVFKDSKLKKFFIPALGVVVLVGVFVMLKGKNKNTQSMDTPSVIVPASKVDANTKDVAFFNQINASISSLTKSVDDNKRATDDDLNRLVTDTATHLTDNNTKMMDIVSKNSTAYDKKIDALNSNLQTQSSSFTASIDKMLDKVNKAMDQKQASPVYNPVAQSYQAPYMPSSPTSGYVSQPNLATSSNTMAKSVPNIKDNYDGAYVKASVYNDSKYWTGGSTGKGSYIGPT